MSYDEEKEIFLERIAVLNQQDEEDAHQYAEDVGQAVVGGRGLLEYVERRIRASVLELNSFVETHSNVCSCGDEAVAHVDSVIGLLVIPLIRELIERAASSSNPAEVLELVDSLCKRMSTEVLARKVSREALTEKVIASLDDDGEVGNAATH